MYVFTYTFYPKEKTRPLFREWLLIILPEYFSDTQSAVFGSFE